MNLQGVRKILICFLTFSFFTHSMIGGAQAQTLTKLVIKATCKAEVQNQLNEYKVFICDMTNRSEKPQRLHPVRFSTIDGDGKNIEKALSREEALKVLETIRFKTPNAPTNSEVIAQFLAALFVVIFVVLLLAILTNGKFSGMNYGVPNFGTHSTWGSGFSNQDQFASESFKEKYGEIDYLIGQEFELQGEQTATKFVLVPYKVEQDPWFHFEICFDDDLCEIY